MPDKYAACQLVQGGVIRGYIHLIGAISSSGSPLPLCNHPQVHLCDPSPWQLYPTDHAANCPRCAKVTTGTPLIIEYPHPILNGAS
jgi:hypothetical protein